MILKTLSFIFLIMLCEQVGAETENPFQIEASKPISEFWVNPGFYSYHLQKEKNLNNSNPGWGVEYRYSNVNSITVGGFFNSVRHTSRYVGWTWQPLSLGSVRLGGAVELLDGYPGMLNGSWFVAVIPAATIEYQRVGLNLIFIPPVKDKVYSALSFQFKLRLD